MSEIKTAKRWYTILTALARPLLRAKTRIKTIGIEHVPATGPAILVSNHRSSDDPRILACVIPRHVAWVAAAYMRDVPLTGWIMRKIGVLFVPTISRGGAATFYKHALSLLRQGDVLGIFPEGEDYIFANDFTAPPAPFHHGFAALALRTGAPVIPVAICPVEERLKPVQMPPSVRKALSHVHAIERFKMIPSYKTVCVVFGPAIEAPPDTTDDPTATLATHTRDVIVGLMNHYAPSPPNPSGGS